MRASAAAGQGSSTARDPRIDRAVSPPLRAGRTVLALSLGLALAACGGQGKDAPSAATSTAPDKGERADVRKAATSALILDPDTGRRIAYPDREIFDAPTERGDEGQRRPAPQPDPIFRSQGSWSAAKTWPEMAIHGAVTPDGRVMTYGTDPEGNQGAQFNYSVWDPATDTHMELPNTTPTDIFCSAQVLLPGNGDLLIAGGDIRGRQIRDENGVIQTNYGVDDVNRFSYTSNSLTPDTPMQYARWYASVLTLPDGRIYTSGGVDENDEGVPHPEIYDPATRAWTVLPGVRFFTNYPRTFLSPAGKVIFLYGNDVREIDVSGAGSMATVAALPDATNWMLPSVEYDVGKLLVLGGEGRTSLVDVNGPTPQVVEGARVGTRRDWSSLTVLADGQVLLTGGGVANTGGDNVSRDAALWNPATGVWTPGASAAKSREYHSIALLLADGRVLTAGGGAPGPVNQLNGEIYTPPYLYDAAGNLAARPTIASAPATLTRGTTPYRFQMGSAEAISKVTLVRSNSVTHAFNFDQGFVQLAHTQAGDQISVDVNRSAAVLRPGYYMLFALNAQGVPSVAKIIRVDQATVEPPAPAERSISANFDNFRNSAGLSLVGAAEVASNGRLLVTPGRNDQVGAAWYRTPALLDAQTSFAQRLRFRSSERGAADGLALVIQGAGPTAIGLGGGSIGYGGITNSVAIEIDSYQNEYDPDANHIAVLTNGELVARASYSPREPLAARTPRTLFVDYDAPSRQLKVYLRMQSSQTRPARPVITFPIDLAATLGTDRLYLGLTSGTGGVSNNYQVERWLLDVGPRALSSIVYAPDDGTDTGENDGTPVDTSSLSTADGEVE